MIKITPPYGYSPAIPVGTIEAIKPLAVEIARILAESGNMNREIYIDTWGFIISSPDAGYPFNPEDEDQIFRAEEGGIPHE